MVKLHLPLHCYDAAGHINPPNLLWLVLGFMGKSYLIFFAALSMGELAEYSLRLVYPQKPDLYEGLAVGSLSVISVFLVSFREKIWQAGYHRAFIVLKPLLITGLCLELGLSLRLLEQLQWAFSWGIAFRVFGASFALWWVVSSRHLRLMCLDWQRKS